VYSPSRNPKSCSKYSDINDDGKIDQTDFDAQDYPSTPGENACSPLGAIHRSNPVIVTPPEPNAAEQSYSNGPDSFYAKYKTRPTMLYTQTMDGMLHAFVVAKNSTSANPSDPFHTGAGSSIGIASPLPEVEQLQNNELWSFIPPAVLPQLWPPSTSTRLLDGPVAVGNVVFSRSETELQNGDAGTSGFRTVLVGSSGVGRTGFYYAMDVTDPLSPRFLWQLVDHDMGGRLFGDTIPGAAITTLKFRDESSRGRIRQVGVAILPGGRTASANPTKMADRKILSSSRNPRFEWNSSTGYQPRTKVRDWGPADPSRSVTVVELETGRIIARFAGTWADNPGAAASGSKAICDGNSSGPDQTRCGLRASTMVHPDRVSFDSPMTGTPSVFPTGTGQVASRAYIGDADGTLWRLDFTDVDPKNWKAEVAFDAYSNEGNESVLNRAYVVNGLGMGGALGLSATEDEAAMMGEPIEQPAVISVDSNNVPVVSFTTGRQDGFNVSRPGTLHMLATFLDSPSADSESFEPTIDATRGQLMVFRDGGRVIGPLTMFDGRLYVGFFEPNVVGVCGGGTGGWCAVDYLAGDEARPIPFMDLDDDPSTGENGNDRCVAFENGEVVFGISVTAVPSCVPGEDDFNDQYLSGQYNSYSGSRGLKYQLVMQTSQGGDTQDGSSLKTKRQDLPTPKSRSRLQSWVSVMQ
jgi:type IV pilus assembly protein PilY1